MNKTIILLIAIIAFSGCAKLRHLPQLLTLKAYSKNQDMQKAYVQEQDQKFKKLIKVISKQEGEGLLNRDKESFVAEFGDPVGKKEVLWRDKMHERWLYRYAVRFFNSEKVYVFFDEAGIVQGIETSALPAK